MSDSVLLVMDMMNDLIHPEGPNAKTYAPIIAERGVIERTRELIGKARIAGVRVGFVRVGFSPDYVQCPPNSPVFSAARQKGLFKLGSWGTEIHPALGPQPDDLDIVKHRVSPFYGTSLEPTLRALGTKRLFLTGVSTNGVVHTGVREGHDRDYACVVVEDCCAGISDEEHRNAISCMQRFAKIQKVSEVDLSA
ncbi:cysteine hydrolase family protein [Roseomonas populi]|uniref:Cysteine hydrolase n=1 Tax=Roseomonas populi TaxID=3121582 RepID=A0ABT1XEP3_9PROT|nr:cysteine hydrolase [Roseomonas pecuniae]MCR0985444.1 cysteine hydrolase [Roseomonas pecuniae]